MPPQSSVAYRRGEKEGRTHRERTPTRGSGRGKGGNRVAFDRRLPQPVGEALAPRTAAYHRPRSPLPGGRIVKSRYLQNYKDAANVGSVNLFSTSTVKPSSATKQRSVLQRSCKTPADTASGSLNHYSFEKNDLQSTLLDGDKVGRPDLDLSAINDKIGPQNAPDSNSESDNASKTSEDSEEMENDSDSQMRQLESQTMLLTYLRAKGGKNLAELEEKAEENLLRLCEGKERQQRKFYKLKREILLRERDQKLGEALDKQMEVLSRLVPVCEQFKEQYKSFAHSLDDTRHELPMKNIHIEGDTLTYLDELQKQLTVTQELLTELMPSYSENSAKAPSLLKELKEVSQKLEKELQRSFTQVQKLSFEISKEVSLHNQRICEENHGLDVVKHWYFD
ncbi:HAUS augmin-like complex subunit 8 isoform X1 [Calypte anna]|uniref:HAUS augmin-like complex subunit 8 isoform X1 n=1 Tax=Calypte anna TaxID=9244 RepID=UPI0011C3A0B7|nr:HAUS augmin-like complex subunit 8 isoform X1 [Calypte anna]